MYSSGNCLQHTAAAGTGCQAAAGQALCMQVCVLSLHMWCAASAARSTMHAYNLGILLNKQCQGITLQLPLPPSKRYSPSNLVGAIGTLPTAPAAPAACQPLHVHQAVACMWHPVVAAAGQGPDVGRLPQLLSCMQRPPGGGGRRAAVPHCWSMPHCNGC
jgi:hypothetical protein